MQESNTGSKKGITIGLLVSVVRKCHFGTSLVTRFDRAFDGFSDLNVSTSGAITDSAVDVELLCYTGKELLLQFFLRMGQNGT